MENSEVQQDIIKLGKLLVKELEKKASDDTLSRWMAHYISEKIVASEAATGNKKKALEKECFDTILKLWAHRWDLPSNRRPFREFEQIFEILKKLSPERQTSFYLPWLPDNFRDKKLKENIREKDWLAVSLQIDKSARICIEFALKQAADAVRGERTEEYLQHSSKIAAEYDREIIGMLLDKKVGFLDKFGEDNEIEGGVQGESNQVTSTDEKLFATEKIKSRISHLEALLKNSKKVLRILKQQLNEE